MIEFFSSSTSFFIYLSLFAVGAIGSIILNKKDNLANIWGNFFATAGSVWGIIFAISSLASPATLAFSINSPVFHALSASFYIDKLSAFFIFIISLIALFCSTYGLEYSKHYFGKYNIGVLGLFYNIFIASMVLVVSASNMLFFLIAWEIMAVISYFLVIYDHDDKANRKAGLIYLIMTHVGTAFIVVAFLLIYKFTNSFDFGALRMTAGVIPLSIKNIAFVLMFIGFGTKAGIIPFHIWLPSAHPAAPSHISGLMSGVMIKTGIFMMIRFFFDIFQIAPLWWGLTILIMGSISSLLGVLYAITEHDIKRLLAYHSIENIGIILLGLGSALTFNSLGRPDLSLLALTASLFHILNHAIFKSLLFLSAGSVINETHTRNMEEYGGLIKYMPQTAACFLIGSMAITALPPFNGFFSEWFTFQSLFQGIISSGSYVKLIFMMSAGALAFTGGLALLCFVKAFGSIFLARPRSEEVHHAKESGSMMLSGMAGLAILSLLFGVFSGTLSTIIGKVAQSLYIGSAASQAANVSSAQKISVGNFSSVSGLAILLALSLTALFVFFITKYLIYRKQKVTVGATWNCGTDLTPRMEITSTSFARTIILMFKGILRPNIEKRVEYVGDTEYITKSKEIILSTQDLYSEYLYEPMIKASTFLSDETKDIQNGNLSSYILYIFATLLIMLFFSSL